MNTQSTGALIDGEKASVAAWQARFSGGPAEAIQCGFLLHFILFCFITETSLAHKRAKAIEDGSELCKFTAGLFNPGFA